MSAPPLLLATDPPERLLEEFPRLSPLVEPGRAAGPSRAPDRPWAAIVRSHRGVRSLIRRQEGHAGRCLWVAVPDPDRLEEWGAELAGAGYPLALVAGEWSAAGRPPWKRIRGIVALRGDEDLVVAARKRGLWIHFREVNSARRVRSALRLGASSIDAGEPARRWPGDVIPRLHRELRREELQQLLPFDAPRPARKRAGAKGRGAVAELPPVAPSPATPADPFDDGPPRAIVVFRVRDDVPWPRRISRWVLSDPFRGALPAETYDLVARVSSRWPYRLLGDAVEIERPGQSIRLDAEQAFLASETGGFGLRRLS